MIKKYCNSRIEIWNHEYINNTEDCPRDEENSVDKVFIGQIEHGHDDDYIVEVVPIGCGLINFGT